MKNTIKVLKDVMHYGRGKGVAQELVIYGSHILIPVLKCLKSNPFHLYNTQKTKVRVGAYPKPNTMKHINPVGESATTPHPRRVWLYLCEVLGQAPLILNQEMR